MLRWVLDKEPVIVGAFLVAVGVVVEQVDQNGLAWQVLYSAVPLAVGAGVRQLVFSRETVAKAVAGQRAALGEMAYPATDATAEAVDDAVDDEQRETLDPPAGMFHRTDPAAD